METLDAYRDLGVQNLLVVRGDLPREDPEFRPHPQSLPHASDLLSFIRSRYDFCLGAAGYPEGHAEAASREHDWDFLRLKVERGAQFVITQYFYDNRFYFDFVARCRAAGIGVPIVPGIMPIFSVQQEAAALDCDVDWGAIDMMPVTRNHPYVEPEQVRIPADFLDEARQISCARSCCCHDGRRGKGMADRSGSGPEAYRTAFPSAFTTDKG